MVKKHILFILLVTAFSPQSWAQAPDQDPYSAVEHIKLDNGMQLFLAPSEKATLTSIKVEVDVGWDAEDPSCWGLSHLLEHVLFRDKELKDEMSYLQLIREAGGTANGSTQARLTSYFGSIPAAKGTWLLKNFHKMILQPTIKDEYVQKEKGTVEIEIGRPSPLVEFLGFYPLDFMYPAYLREPEFWESEFGYKAKKQFTPSAEQLSNRRLDVDRITQHYKDYYYPSNMRLYIAGKFDRAEIMAEVQSLWASLPGRTGKSLPPEEPLLAKLVPYYRSKISDTPYVAIGSKVLNATLFEQEVLRSYSEFLTHRWMKEIRNLKGQTYSAQPTTYFVKGSGYTIVSFSTPKESFQENLTFAQDYIEKETHGAGLTPAQVNEAINLYLSQYQLKGGEAEIMMEYATKYSEIVRDYSKFDSPYKLLKNSTPENYNSALQKHFSKKLAYQYLYEPNKFFPYDQTVMVVVTLICAFLIFRRVLTKPFMNDRIQWVRKLSSPPLKLMEVFAMTTSWYIYAHIGAGLERLFMWMPSLYLDVITSEYLINIVAVFLFVGCAQLTLSVCFRKLMVMDSKLVIKSLSYFSYSFPLSDIKIIATQRYVFYSPRMWKKIKHRYFFYSPLFWKKGLYIERTDGRAYFFGVKDAEAVKRELTSIKERQLKEPSEERPAA